VPQGTSNAHHVATLAGLKTRGNKYTTNGEGHQATSSRFLAALTQLIGLSWPNILICSRKVTHIVVLW